MGDYMKKVSVRGGFSDRNGIKAENTEIQIINFDEKNPNSII